MLREPGEGPGDLTLALGCGNPNFSHSTRSPMVDVKMIQKFYNWGCLTAFSHTTQLWYMPLCYTVGQEPGSPRGHWEHSVDWGL